MGDKCNNDIRRRQIGLILNIICDRCVNPCQSLRHTGVQAACRAENITGYFGKGAAPSLMA